MQLQEEIKKQRQIVNNLYEQARRHPGPLYQSRWYPLLLAEYDKLDRLVARAAGAKGDCRRFPWK